MSLGPLCRLDFHGLPLAAADHQQLDLLVLRLFQQLHQREGRVQLLAVCFQQDIVPLQTRGLGGAVVDHPQHDQPLVLRQIQVCPQGVVERAAQQADPVFAQRFGRGNANGPPLRSTRLADLDLHLNFRLRPLLVRLLVFLFPTLVGPPDRNDGHRHHQGQRRRPESSPLPRTQLHAVPPFVDLAHQRQTLRRRLQRQAGT